MKNYQILYFDKSMANIGIKFEGLDCLNFQAPFANGAYLSGQELEDAIQALYPYTQDEMRALAPTLTGGEDIEAKVIINP